MEVKSDTRIIPNVAKNDIHNPTSAIEYGDTPRITINAIKSVVMLSDSSFKILAMYTVLSIITARDAEGVKPVKIRYATADIIRITHLSFLGTNNFFSKRSKNPTIIDI